MQEVNNQVDIVGEVASDLEFSHEVYSESFYNFKIKIARLSNVHDLISATVSDKLLKVTPISEGNMVKINGQFRSYNNYSDMGNRLMLTVFVKDMEPVYEEVIKSLVGINSIYLSGYVCKNPIYRVTPFGREISDVLLAVNRSYSKSDYIPCIAWGRNAKFTSILKPGNLVKIWGRVQSRNYQKKVDDQTFEEKTAYEVSVSKLEMAKELDSEQGELG